MVRVRFAPSPTGLLHVGNARTALVNWLFARKQRGAFVLRLDDTDSERSRSEFAGAIRDDLRWLGLAWDEEHAQSARMDRYAAAAERLKAAGRLYPCYETPEELERWRKARQRRGLPPVYSRAARDDAVHAHGEGEGRAPHWRFAIDRDDGRRIAWRDLVRGAVEFDAANIADPVLVKSDGQPLYGLSSVVDDIDMAVTHVVRGEDHVANTAQQVQLFAALGADPESIAFAHLPLLSGAEGTLSKREGALSLRDLREDGIEPMALNALLAALGTSDAVEPAADLDALAARFDWAKFGRASPQFDPAALAALNAKLLHDTPFATVRDRLAAMGLEADDAFWRAVRPNIVRLAEAAEWWRIVAGPVDPAVEEPSFLAEALETLPPEPWDEATWAAWTAALGARTGRKGRALFHPLRLALTGRERGPELKNLLPLIGRARAAARLAGRAA